MYNDYYLQQIDSKLATTNTNLTTIITNQETIITNQDGLKQEVKMQGILVTSAMILYLLWFFIVRCFK